nr:MAG TPA: hypothetical protein [Caudoviricetes sp.]
MSVHLGQCKYRNYLAKMLLRELLFFYFQFKFTHSYG